MSCRNNIKNHSLFEYLDPASKQSNLQKVRNFVDEKKFLTNWETIEHDGWKLIATQEQHDWCGMWQTLGCLNHEKHFQLGKGRRVYIKQYQRSCYRSSCKECYPKWIARQANVGTQRIEKFKELSKRQSIHLLLSVHQSDYGLSYKELKKKVKQILDIIEFDGGAVVFHPFRFSKTSKRWFYSPHFHIVGFGWRRFILRGYGKFGWFVKDLGIRESVFQTFCYLLSHCGIRKGTHTVSWMGQLSYSKLKVEKEHKITECPICGADFLPVYYNGVHPVVPPDKHFEGLVDDDGEWYPIQTVEYQIPRYDYAPTRELNDTLQELAVAN
jgi:hypothetical protein